MSGNRTRDAIAGVLRAGGAALLLTAVGIFHVWSHTRVITSGYDLARLEAEQRRLLAERDRLRLEVSTLRAPGRLERFARERLGMAPPAPGTIEALVADGRAVAGRAGEAVEIRTRAPAEPVSRTGGARLAMRAPSAPRVEVP